MNDDDLLAFAEDDPAPVAAGGEPWKVLVVDDDEEVHLVTALTLRHVLVDGAPLGVSHADSFAAARRAFAEEGPFAVAVLDVVMEAAHAGLDLAEWVRRDLHDRDVRLLLRTGQPGDAREAQLSETYDIHDYLPKAETTGYSLQTRVMGAVRAWRDLAQARAEGLALRAAIDHLAAGGPLAGLPALAPALLDPPRGQIVGVDTGVPVGPDAWLQTPAGDAPNRVERWRIAALSDTIARVVSKG